MKMKRWRIEKYANKVESIYNAPPSSIHLLTLLSVTELFTISFLNIFSPAFCLVAMERKALCVLWMLSCSFLISQLTHWQQHKHYMVWYLVHWYDIQWPYIISEMLPGFRSDFLSEPHDKLIHKRKPRFESYKVTTHFCVELPSAVLVIKHSKSQDWVQIKCMVFAYVLRSIPSLLGVNQYPDD